MTAEAGEARPHAVSIVHRTKPGQRSTVAEVWQRLLKPAIEANPDHLAYVYTLADDEPDVIRAFQLYRSSNAAAAFLNTPEYLAYTDTVDEYLAFPPEVVSAPATWVKPHIPPSSDLSGDGLTQ